MHPALPCVLIARANICVGLHPSSKKEKKRGKQKAVLWVECKPHEQQVFLNSVFLGGGDSAFTPYRIFGPVLRERTALCLPAFLSRASIVNRMKALNLIGTSIVRQNGRVAEMSKHFPEIWATYLFLKATAKFLNVTFALWKDLQGIRNQTKPGFHPLQ